MDSIQDVFSEQLMLNVKQIAVFICKREHSAYTRNRTWLTEGKTGWWPISKDRRIDGIVLLLQSKDEDFFEVWYGLSKGNGGRIRQRDTDGRWLLGVNDSFELAGLTKVAQTTKEFLGKQPGTCVTYIEKSSRPKKSLKSVLTLSKFEPKFSPEFSGDRTISAVGEYTAKSEHGVVISALHRWLKDNGYKHLDNRGGNWDLYAFSKKDIPYLFELKTKASTTDIYMGIGQLNIYNISLKAKKKILVLPANTSAEAWRPLLGALGISVWFYHLHSNNDVVFSE